MQIMECARAAGVSLDTVRHYARLGLINAVAGGRSSRNRSTTPPTANPSTETVVQSQRER